MKNFSKSLSHKQTSKSEIRTRKKNVHERILKISPQKETDGKVQGNNGSNTSVPNLGEVMGMQENSSNSSRLGIPVSLKLLPRFHVVWVFSNNQPGLLASQLNLMNWTRVSKPLSSFHCSHRYLSIFQAQSFLSHHATFFEGVIVGSEVVHSQTLGQSFTSKKALADKLLHAPLRKNA